MKILHKHFDVVWSWTEIAKGLQKALKNLEWTDEPSSAITKCEQYDVILTQQPFMLVSIKTRYKAITRIGTNSIFDGRYDMKEISKYLAESFAVIATNKFLYETAKAVNPNTYLIPNGLDLKEWAPFPKKGGRKKFIAGFVGNISTPDYREYKGFDFIEQSCKELKIELRTALYGTGQIPHDRMRADFYSTVSCIVHPTRGEGCSNTLLEALALGIPVITTKAAGYHGEMLKNGDNVLFCERTKDSVLSCIKKLQDDKKLRDKLSVNGRKFAEKNHDITEIAKQYDLIIQACYRHSKIKEKEIARLTSEKVLVKVIKHLIENYKVYQPGDIFETTRIRAMALRSLVEIIEQ